MLLLEMVTLEPMHNYYDFTRLSIDYDSLIHRLSRISHSLPLKTLIAEMLEYDPEERVGLLSLKEKLRVWVRGGRVRRELGFVGREGLKWTRLGGTFFSAWIVA